MTATIHQPDFLPYLGFFDRWKRSDIYIILDDVQFIRRGWHHRDRIKTQEGIRWLTVPVKKRGRYFQHIKDIEIDNASDWVKRHLNTIKSAYARAPYYNRVYPMMEKIYSRRYGRLIDLNMELLKLSVSILGIETPFRFSSGFKIDAKGTRRLLELMKAVGADTYLTGVGAKAYLDESLFGECGIKVIWQEFVHPVYPQLYGDFKRGLSVLDYLMMKCSRF